MSTLAKKYFSDKEISSYERDGFILVHGMYLSAEIKELSGWIDALVERGPQVGKEMFYYEDSLLEKGKSVLSRIERFADFNEKLRGFVREDKLAAAPGNF